MANAGLALFGIEVFNPETDDFGAVSATFDSSDVIAPDRVFDGTAPAGTPFEGERFFLTLPGIDGQAFVTVNAALQGFATAIEVSEYGLTFENFLDPDGSFELAGPPRVSGFSVQLDPRDPAIARLVEALANETTFDDMQFSRVLDDGVEVQQQVDYLFRDVAVRGIEENAGRQTDILFSFDSLGVEFGEALAEYDLVQDANVNAGGDIPGVAEVQEVGPGLPPAGPPLAEPRYFLSIDGVPGTSPVFQFPDAIEIDAYRFDLRSLMGLQPDEVPLTPFTVEGNFGAGALIELAGRTASGRAISSMTLEVAADLTGAGLDVFQTIEFRNVYLQNMENAGLDRASVDFVFSQLRYSVADIDPQTGAVGQAEFFVDLGRDDLIMGTAGDDFLFGGDGNNTLIGGAGDDSIQSGEGNDTIITGPGDDVVFGPASSLNGDLITDLQPGGLVLVQGATLQGAFGLFAFDPETGEWSYQADPESDALGDLAAGEQAFDTLQVTSLDGTATATITITVTGPPDPVLTLEDQVLTRFVGALEGVAVTFTAEEDPPITAQTDAEGVFVIDLPAGAEGRLEAARGFDAAVAVPPISASDALEILRMAVGLMPSFGEPDAFAFIAADVNRDGAVTAADALEVLRHAVGLSTEAAPQWVLVDAQADFSGIGRDSVAFQTGIDFNAADPDPGAAFVGILLGAMQDTV